MDASFIRGKIDDRKSGFTCSTHLIVLSGYPPFVAYMYDSSIFLAEKASTLYILP